MKKTNIELNQTIDTLFNMIIADKCDLDLFRQELENITKHSSNPAEDYTHLFYSACTARKEELAAILLPLIDVNLPLGPKRWTPLHVAIVNKAYDIALQLLESIQINIFAVDTQGFIPFNLLEQNADTQDDKVSLFEERLWTKTHESIAVLESAEKFKILIEDLKATNAPSQIKNSAQMILRAIIPESDTISESLTHADAYVEILIHVLGEGIMQFTMEDRETLLDFAIMHHLIKCISLLVKRGHVLTDRGLYHLVQQWFSIPEDQQLLETLLDTYQPGSDHIKSLLSDHRVPMQQFLSETLVVAYQHGDKFFFNTLLKKHIALLDDIPEILNSPPHSQSISMLRRVVKHIGSGDLLKQITFKDQISIKDFLSSTDSESNTLCHLACIHDRMELLKLFYLEKSNHPRNSLVHAVNLEGNTPQHLACLYGRLEMLKRLSNYGTDLNHHQNKAGNTLLHIACKRNDIEMVKWLVENYMSLDAINNEGHTALHCAAVYTTPDIVNFLQAFYEWVDVKNLHDDTALGVARKAERIDNVNVLLECGADPNEEKILTNSPSQLSSSQTFFGTDTKRRKTELEEVADDLIESPTQSITYDG